MKKKIILPILSVVAFTLAMVCSVVWPSGSASATSCPGTTAVCFPGGFGGKLTVGAATVYNAAGSFTIPFPTGFGNAIYVGASQVYAPGGGTTTTTTAATTTTTTIAATTTTAAPTTTTTTTIPATTTTVAGGSPACGLAAAAFCETFDAPHNGGTQTGDLDPVVWGVSRIGLNDGQNQVNAVVQSHNPCAGGAAVLPASDVRICGGQMVESINDGGGVPNLDTYPKQPFDFAGRTGKVVFDVSADSGGTHAAWPEFLITDKPVPGARSSVSAQPPPAAQNEVGFEIVNCNGQPTLTAIGVVFYTVNGVYHELNNSRPNCITQGSSTSMNHFEVDVSQSHINVYGTDAGASTLKLLASEDVPLTFTSGLVWMNDVHYNARKAVEPCQCGTQFDHAFFWDNLGFDGPKTYRDLGYDIPLAHVSGPASQYGDVTENEGYFVAGSHTFTTPAVTIGTATAAQVVMNAYQWDNSAPITVSVNGHTAVAVTAPITFNTSSLRFPIPLTDVVAGANTITITAVDGHTVVSNVSLIMVAAAAVP